MKAALFLAVLAITSPAMAQDDGCGDDESYYDYSEDTQWYDSYGRLKTGYQDAPMKSYPQGREPYYYYSDDSAWYDSYGRLRYGPRGIPASDYRRGRR